MFTWLFIGLTVWGIYRRILKLIGTQVFKPGWVVVRVAFLLFGMALILPRVSHMGNILLVLIGTLIGGGMLYFMVRYTLFWVDGSNVVYKSNPYFGSIILVLVLSRLLYKIPVLFSLIVWLSHARERTPDLSILNKALDPISAVMITMLMIYFLGSNLYIFVVARRIQKQDLNRQIRRKSCASDSSSQE